ncbi:uncharacterized protein E6C27_scaffold1220G00260 [Cucumis melo var. makuwa]|uniref:Uncharacterized protein n=1 Tax=Cucumis melo var. makuwa TaxID=1194695 RepID=A0A5A7SLQ3_CUCMM|nr:uncharacterized protein E6C27_scaffold1220G00260 [Cucumis melo var. makuwa]
MDAWTKCGDLKRNERLERIDGYWWVVVGVEGLTTTFDGEERRLGLGQRLEKKKMMMIERAARDTTSDGTNLGDTTSDGNQIDETVDVTIDARISIAMEKWFHYLQTMPKNPSSSCVAYIACHASIHVLPSNFDRPPLLLLVTPHFRFFLYLGSWCESTL